MAPAVSIAAPAQHKQPSRKSKQAWRKHVDLTEVDDGLERLRQEIILDGGPVSERPSHELFAVDARGEDPNAAAKTRSRPRSTKRPLRSDLILGQRSAVPAVDTRVRGAAEAAGSPAAKRRKRDRVGAEEYERLRKRAYAVDAVPKDVVETHETATRDLWAGDASASTTSAIRAAGEEAGATVIAGNASTPYVKGNQESNQEGNGDRNNIDEAVVLATTPFVARAPKTLRAAPVSLLRSGRALPAVPRPARGTSYNPLFADWDARLARHADAEVQAELVRQTAAQRDADIEERRALVASKKDAGVVVDDDDDEEAARKFFGKIATAKDAATAAEDSVWEGFESEYDRRVDEAAEERARKMPKRKTRADRNRIERRKAAEREDRAKKDRKARDKEAARVREIAKQVNEEEEARKEKEKQGMKLVVPSGDSSDEQSDMEDAPLRKRLPRKAPLPRQTLDVVLPDELRDSLRLLRPEGNPLRDRFRSLVLRGKLEARARLSQQRKARREVTEKWSYKDFGVVA